MADSLLDNYNPLYDIHLRQYFALPHMQKHLRRLGLIDSSAEVGDEVYARHHAMLDMMLKNREVQLMKMAELKRKLDAAEKVETCRRIRSGQSPESYNRMKSSRSLSRGRQRPSEKQRRHSNSIDDKEIVQRIEKEHFQAVDYDPKDPYSRLSANIKRFQYLHRLDDPTLSTYKETLKKQLLRLERFRDISFGIHSVARQPPTPHQSWFFRRRSTNSIRGRKSHHSPHSVKLSQSHESRTSCPPSTRKRKDSNSKLPPIGNGKAPKSVHPQSHPSLLRAMSPSQRPPVVRGRSVTKKLPAASKTFTTATPVLHPSAVQPERTPTPEISGLATTKEHPTVSTIETTDENSDNDKIPAVETISALQQKPETRTDPIGVRKDGTPQGVHEDHVQDIEEKFVAEEVNTILNKVGQESSVFERVEPFPRSNEEQLQKVDSAKAEHGKRDDDYNDDGDSSGNVTTGEREMLDHLSLNGENKIKSADSHQTEEFSTSDFVMKDEPNKSEESEAGSRDLREVPLAASVYRNDGDSEEIPKDFLSNGNTLCVDDSKSDAQSHSPDDHSFQEQKDELAVHQQFFEEEAKSSQVLANETQSTTPELTERRQQGEILTESEAELEDNLYSTDGPERVTMHRNSPDQKSSKIVESDKEGRGHRLYSDTRQHFDGEYSSQDYQALHDHSSERNNFMTEPRLSDGDPVQDEEISHKKHVMATSVSHEEGIVPNTTLIQSDDPSLKLVNNGQLYEEVIGASKESARNASEDQKVGSEKRTISTDTFKHNVSHEEGMVSTTTVIQSDDPSLKLAEHEHQYGALGAAHEDTNKDSKDQEEEFEKHIISPETTKPDLSHEESMASTTTVIQSDDPSLKLAEHEHQYGALGAAHEDTNKDSKDQEEEFEKHIISPETTKPDLSHEESMASTTTVIQSDDPSLKLAEHEQQYGAVGAADEDTNKDSKDQEEEFEKHIISPETTKPDLSHEESMASTTTVIQSDDPSLKLAEHEQQYGVVGAAEDTSKGSEDQEEEFEKHIISPETTKPDLSHEGRMVPTTTVIQSDDPSLNLAEHEQQYGAVGAADEDTNKESKGQEEEFEKRIISPETTKPDLSHEESMASTTTVIQSDDPSLKLAEHEQQYGVVGAAQDTSKGSEDQEEEFEKHIISPETTKPDLSHEESMASTTTVIQSDDPSLKLAEHEQQYGVVGAAQDTSIASEDQEEEFEKHIIPPETTKPDLSHEESMASTTTVIQSDDPSLKLAEHEQQYGAVGAADEDTNKESKGQEEEFEKRIISPETTMTGLSHEESMVPTTTVIQSDDPSLKLAEHEQQYGAVGAADEDTNKESKGQEEEFEKRIISPETTKPGLSHEESMVPTTTVIQSDDPSLKLAEHEQQYGVVGAADDGTNKESKGQEEEFEKRIISPETTKPGLSHEESMVPTTTVIQSDDPSLKLAEHEKQYGVVGGAEDTSKDSEDQEEEFEKRIISPETTKPGLSHEESMVPTTTVIQSDDPSLKLAEHEQQYGVVGAADDGTNKESKDQEEEFERRIISLDTTEPIESDVMSPDPMIVHYESEQMAQTRHRVGDIVEPSVYEPHSSVSCLQKSEEQQIVQFMHANDIPDTVPVPSLRGEMEHKYDHKSAVHKEEKNLLEFRDIYDSQGNKKDYTEVHEGTKFHGSSQEDGEHSLMDVVSSESIRTDSRRTSINGANNAAPYHHSDTVNDYTTSHGNVIHHDNGIQSFSGSDEENNNDDGKSIKLSDDETTSLLSNSGAVITETGLTNAMFHQGEHERQNIPST